MRSRILLGALSAAVVIVVASAIFFLAPPDVDESVVRLKPGDLKLVRLGADIYAQNCAACHGDDLKGERDWMDANPDGSLKAPPHDETGHTWHHPDQQLFQITKLGIEALAPEGYESHEWWIKSSRSASMTPGEWDFPPHVVTVHDKFAPKLWQSVEGELILRESPWDPIADLLPVKGEPSARLVNEQLLAHDIALAKPLDAQAFEPFASTISSSRWPGVMGGPTREVDYSAYLT